jgi:hypothetical protein
MCQYANHIIYQHSKTNFEKFCLGFYITKKGSPNFFFEIAQKGSKIVYFCQKVPFLGKNLSKFIVIGPKIIDNDTGKFVRLSAF